MTIAATNEPVDQDARTIRDREDRREALRARLFGAQAEPAAPKGLIARLETEVKNLDAEIRELKARAAESIDSMVELQA
jgi:hypothetical protein